MLEIVVKETGIGWFETLLKDEGGLICQLPAASTIDEAISNAHEFLERIMDEPEEKEYASPKRR